MRAGNAATGSRELSRTRPGMHPPDSPGGLAFLPSALPIVLLRLFLPVCYLVEYGVQ